MADGDGPSDEALEVLSLLTRHHNVLVSGPPGTGKSRVLNEVRRWFQAPALPAYDPLAEIPLPEGMGVVGEHVAEWLPGADQGKREVFSTSFHQGSKYRDFVRGLVPIVGAPGFEVSSGTLYRAAAWALEPDAAALVIIDEINRGPAVQVFGDTLVAIEADKRLGPGGEELATTQWIEVMDDDGGTVSFALPYHLYILAAMNQADTSVEPLDVAFLRRFTPFRLEPREDVLRDHFGLGGGGEADGLPVQPGSAKDVYEAAVRAWSRINARIRRGRGTEYQIGHGVFMESRDAPPYQSAEEALKHVAEPWARIRSHLDEVFFGHVRGVAAVLNVGAVGHPFQLAESLFAGDPVVTLEEPPHTLYELFRAVGSPDAD